MKKHDFLYLTEDPSHDSIIELINDEAFGPGRFAKAAQRIREQGPHDRQLSYVAIDHGDVIASVRMTAVASGNFAGHLLGPLAVRPAYKNLGIGRELVRIAIDGARRKGSDGVILVGDPPYYMPLGFEKVATNAIVFPGPLDPGRVLLFPLREGAHGLVPGTIHWRAG